MIKIKNVENLNDDQSITMQRLKSFLVDNEGTKSFKSATLKSKKLLQHNQSKNIQNIQSINGLQQYSSHRDLLKNAISNGQLNDKTLSEDFFINKRRKNYRQNGAHLKQIVTQQKIKLIIRNFITKLRRNNINSKVIQYTPFNSDADVSILDQEGFQLHQFIFIAMSTLSVFQIVLLCLLYTLSIVFRQVNQSSLVISVQSVSLFFYFTQIFINFITVKFQQGKRLTTYRQIWTYYIKNTFVLDFISVFILVVDIFANFQATIYLRLFILVKLTQALEKMEKLEIFFINNFYNEQYWSLIKVFLFNFCFAHILAIFLIGMTGIDDSQNWMTAKQIQNSPWYQKYAWSYYWATTIMLTVGFGDISATTYKQAIVLTMIQTISCMALAYNINCIGTLINNIRSQDLQKSKNFKIFRKLARKNNVTQDLEWRINNYIQQSSNIRKKFNHQQQNFFVQKLPKGLRIQFLKQSNKKIFQNLPFFRNLMQKTLFSFAQKIQMHICHPEQILQHIDDHHNLMILKGGKVGYSCKKPGCDYNSIVVDTLSVSQLQEPALISLGFINHNRLMYEIKSLQYSILYFLDEQIVLSILKGSQMDYQLYCLLRDKSSHIPDQYELFKCQLCNGRHTKFTCPKLHFIPIKQHVTNKYLYEFKTGKCKRKTIFYRLEVQKTKTLKIFLQLNSLQPKNVTNQQKEKEKSKLFKIPFLHQRKVFQSFQDGASNFGKQLEQIKDFLSKNTAELIKNQMNRLIHRSQDYDQVWVVETDKIKNYKNYFQSDNACNLMHKFSRNRRNSKQHRRNSFIDICLDFNRLSGITSMINTQNNEQSRRSTIISRNIIKSFRTGVINFQM